MKAEMLGDVHTSNLINQEIENKYRNILYLCDFAIQK